MRRVTSRIALALAGPLMAFALVAGAAAAQSVICCDQIVPVEGNWVGAGRVADCQQEFDSLPPMDAKKWCKQRNRLACLDMRRCGDFAGDPDAAPKPSSNGRGSDGVHASASPDVRDGLEEGFGSPEPTPGTAPPPPTVFFLTWPPDPDGTPVHGFKVWLDAAGCALPIEPDGGVRGSATRMVLGSLARRGGRSQVELRASDLASGAVTAPASADAPGEDARAVASAARSALEGLGLHCQLPPR
jgi:hypothetical protein